MFLVPLARRRAFLPLPDKRMTEAHRFVAMALAVLGVAVLMRVACSVDRRVRALAAGASVLLGHRKGHHGVVGLGMIAVLVCDALGVSLAPALTALGVGSLAVALAMQDTLSNFFSGLYLVVDKPVRPGDFIRVDPTYEGYVETIGWRSTHLRTLSDNLVIIPNATLVQGHHHELHATDAASRLERARRRPFEADLDKVEDALADEARRSTDVPGMADAPAPSVALWPGFVDGGVGFTVSFHVRSFGDQAPVQHALRKRIATRLKKEGIAPSILRAAVLKHD